jgi:glyoxylase-like metal-dependent hydrolase (beta-lactamase superfamily II)
MPNQKTVPLEDELGDVLEKAMRGSEVNLEALAEAAAVPAARIRDAIDYRPDLGCDELRRIATVLKLNEVGLCALGAGRYPLPDIEELPFRIWPLRMAHGIGVANAYLVAEHGAERGLLFDTGAGMPALAAVWPAEIRQLDAVFLTHVEAEHAGGLREVLVRFGAPAAFLPRGALAPGGSQIGEGEAKTFGALRVEAFSTPGHTAAHNCYLVRTGPARAGRALLVSGDLVFAGSAGGGYFSPRQLQAQLRRLLDAVPADTVIAPGHGPLTTAENELKFNPFVL